MLARTGRTCPHCGSCRPWVGTAPCPSALWLPVLSPSCSLLKLCQPQLLTQPYSPFLRFEVCPELRLPRITRMVNARAAYSWWRSCPRPVSSTIKPETHLPCVVSFSFALWPCQASQLLPNSLSSEPVFPGSETSFDISWF